MHACMCARVWYVCMYTISLVKGYSQHDVQDTLLFFLLRTLEETSYFQSQTLVVSEIDC